MPDSLQATRLAVKPYGTPLARIVEKFRLANPERIQNPESDLSWL